MKLLISMIPTILLVVYGQLITKWRVQFLAGNALEDGGKASRAITYLGDPYILSAYVAAFAGAVAWMFVVERYAISVAFPLYIGLTFMFVVLGGIIFFGEEMTLLRVVAIILILTGIAIGARS